MIAISSKWLKDYPRKLFVLPQVENIIKSNVYIIKLLTNTNEKDQDGYNKTSIV